MGIFFYKVAGVNNKRVLLALCHTVLSWLRSQTNSHHIQAYFEFSFSSQQLLWDQYLIFGKSIAARSDLTRRYDARLY